MHLIYQKETFTSYRNNLSSKGQFLFCRKFFNLSDPKEKQLHLFSLYTRWHASKVEGSQYFWMERLSKNDWCGSVGWSVVLYSQVQFPVREYTQVAGSILSWVVCGRWPIDISLSANFIFLTGFREGKEGGQLARGF